MDALDKIQVVLKFTWSFGAIEGKKIEILGHFLTFSLRMQKTLTGPNGKILIKMDTGMIVNKYCRYGSIKSFSYLYICPLDHNVKYMPYFLVATVGYRPYKYMSYIIYRIYYRLITTRTRRRRS